MPHPNAAKLYLTWLLAKEQQSRLGSFSSRGDVPPARRLPTVRVLNYREFMTNDKLVADLRKRLRATPARRPTRAG